REQPPPLPGRLAAAARAGMDQLLGLGRNIQFMLDPMATGSNRAMVIAKDAISTVRRIRWEHARMDAEIVRRFEPEQWERMRNAEQVPQRSNLLWRKSRSPATSARFR